MRIRPVCHSFLLALAVLSVTVRAGEAAHPAGLPPGLAVQTGSWKANA